MTPSPNSRRSRIINAGCASVLFLVMGLCLWMYWTSKQQLYPPEHLFVADQSNPSATAAAFAFSLAHNQLEGMQSYVVEEKWLLIATWPQTHEALSDSCRFDWDPDFQGYTAVGGLSDRQKLTLISGLIMCARMIVGRKCLWMFLCD
ncbi:MAG: hypothetical protein IPL78_23045 [Chloroflexi bacterium]|nr:hypothetical protein [Chloroflexota bacterium]